MAKQRPTPAAIQEALQQAHGLHEQGRLAEAETAYRHLLKLHSTHVDALHGLGLLHYRQQRYDEALVLYDRLRVMLPRHPAILCDRGNALMRLSRTSDALADYDKALALAPDHIAGLYNRGNALLELGRPAEALASYDRALVLQPALAEALANRGNALRSLGHFGEALASYEAALALRPDDAEILNNRGSALFNLGRDREAVSAFEAALARAPQFAQARYNMALALLRQGDFAAGWPAYEARWDSPFFVPQRRGFDVPLWLGQEPVAGRTLLLHAEQGFGDTIQFIRYLPQVAALGAQVLVEVPAELIDLVSGLIGDATVIPRGSALPAFDLHCPLMSLPLAFGTRLDTIPVPIPYLAAPPARAESWRERVRSVPGRRVGLVWAGRRTHDNDAQRSLTLPALDPLLAVKDRSFVSLQKELNVADAAALAERPHIVPLGSDLASFADTAAAIAALDLVVTVDTSVAHLAGAMGKPVWILLPFAPDYRWLTDCIDSPWYPSARLFRQTKPGDWASVIATVAAELAQSGLFPAA
ncbi:MAG: repeat-containing protein [Xanthobacteraceae bacterium]|nr:repeat-containing protein [Xanthobacteraceae bacterium]